MTGLRRFAVPPPAPAPSAVPAAPAVERCELCATPLDGRHGHLVQIEQRSISCACRACYLLFTIPGAAQGRYRAIPDRIRHDPAHPMAVVDWEALQVPVGTAFFFANSALGLVVGSYPSPAGATECDLDLAEWNRLAGVYPLLAAPEPDVEGIFVHRTGDTVQTYLIPIDLCYALVGQLRLRWTGFDGGDGVRTALDEFLADLRQRSREL